MNYTNRFISFTVLAAVLSGCEFNEDFCIRNGELVAWCDFSGIRETPPVPEERHIIAFPSGMDIPSGEQMTFTQDTLCQSIPQGEYQFLFYTGNYEVSDIIRKSKFPQNPKRSVRFSGKGTKRSVQKRKARNTQKAETKVL